MARASQHSPVTGLEYRNPVTGGPALATLACLLEGMPADTQTLPSWETASSVMVIARGTGTLTCGSRTFELNPDDVAAIPAWTSHQLTTRNQELAVRRFGSRLPQVRRRVPRRQMTPMGQPIPVSRAAAIITCARSPPKIFCPARMTAPSASS